MEIKCSVVVLVTLSFVVILTRLTVATGATSEVGPRNDTVNLESTTEEEEEEPFPTKSPEEKRCTEMIGSYNGSLWVGLEVTYDLKSVLEERGGPPGKVNATWTEKEAAPVENATDERPLPIAAEEYWIYSFIDTDNKTWARGEHAVHRFSGTPEEFLEIRGMILWTPDDFCGKARLAFYTVDDRGFTFNVSRFHCMLEGADQYSCTSPGICVILEDNPDVCADEFGDLLRGGEEFHIGLFSSLVGGG